MTLTEPDNRVQRVRAKQGQQINEIRAMLDRIDVYGIKSDHLDLIERQLTDAILGVSTTCSIPQCPVPVGHKASGLCPRHYTRAMSDPKPETESKNPVTRRRPEQIDRCETPECDWRAINSDGICIRHHVTMMRTVDALFGEGDSATGVRSRACMVPGCDRDLHIEGLCASHNSRLVATGDIDIDKPIRRYAKRSPGKAESSYN